MRLRVSIDTSGRQTASATVSIRAQSARLRFVSVKNERGLSRFNCNRNFE